MKAIRFCVLSAVLCAALLAAGSAAGTRAAAGPALTPVMTGLDNPRGITFGKDGALYVAEAGRGGPGPCQLLRQGELPAGTASCYGPTGRISRWWKGRQEAVVTGLPSYSIPNGQATGPHDVTVQGGKALITIGWGDNPALRNTPPSSVWRQFGRLVRADLRGKGRWELGADIAAFEAAANPDHGDLNSNPYGILEKKHQVLVTDAGANDLLRVSGKGDEGSDGDSGDDPGAKSSEESREKSGDKSGEKSGVSLVAVFPSRTTTPPHPTCTAPPPFAGAPTDSVPTSVTAGPDGAYYVGELSGVPFCTGNASIYRIVPGTAPGVASPWCSGFTTIMDLTWGPDGKLYVLERSKGPVFFATPGDVVRVGPGCTKTQVVSGLNKPGSLAFGKDGKLYISINSESQGTGQVVRVD